jgi:uncharacterized tellurite resistance protein B-like protein
MRRAFELLSGLFGGASRPAFDPDDHRVATAAFLAEAAAADGRVADEERARVVAMLARGFGVAESEAREIAEEAARRMREGADVASFARVLHRTLRPEGRARVVEMMAELAAVDGRTDEVEDNVLARAAALLGVTGRGPSG